MKKVFVTLQYLYRANPHTSFQTDNVMWEATVGSRSKALVTLFDEFYPRLNKQYGRENWCINKIVVTGDENPDFWLDIPQSNV